MKFGLLALQYHCSLQDRYEFVSTSSPELPAPFTVPVLPKVNPHFG
jgi:hypothetical protein